MDFPLRTCQGQQGVWGWATLGVPVVGGRGRPLHRGGGFFRRRGGCCSDHSTHVGGSAAWTLQAEFPAGLLTGKPGGETGMQGPLFGICCFTSFRLATARVTTRSTSRRVVPKPGGEARKPLQEGRACPGAGLWRLYQVRLEARPPRHRTVGFHPWTTFSGSSPAVDMSPRAAIRSAMRR